MNNSPDRRLRHRKIVSLVSIAILIVLFTLIGIFVGRPLVKTFREPQVFRTWIADKGVWGKLAMAGIMMLQIVVALIPGEPFELGAGYAFGAVEGTVLCLLGSLAASALVFAVVRKWGTNVVELFFNTQKIRSFSFLHNAKQLDLLVFTLFLIPGTPKDLLTYVIGLTPMRMSTFLLLSTAARIPSVVSSTVTGSMMGQQRYTVAAIVYGITGVLTLICIILYRRQIILNRRADASEKAAPSTEDERKDDVHV